jgi:hypothetical protein
MAMPMTTNPVLEQRTDGQNPGSLRILNQDPKFPPARLVEPTHHGFIYVAARIEPGSERLPVIVPSARRTKLLERLKLFAAQLEQCADVVAAKVFRAIVIPPTARFSSYLRDCQPHLHIANFDVMLLIETTSGETVRDVQMSGAFRAMLDTVQSQTDTVRVIDARNARRIANVDTSRQGLFLFNHFAADDADVMLRLWEYLAGWYVVETGLDNSVALTPVSPAQSDYAIVNWARWDERPIQHFWRQLSKSSFWSYVTRNLDANRAGSMPIYCRLA